MSDRMKFSKYSEGRISKKKKSKLKFTKFDNHDVEMSGRRDQRDHRKNRQLSKNFVYSYQLHTVIVI